MWEKRADTGQEKQDAKANVGWENKKKKIIREEMKVMRRKLGFGKETERMSGRTWRR